MISFARQYLILRPIEKRLYLFADERSEGENKSNYNQGIFVTGLTFQIRVQCCLEVKLDICQLLFECIILQSLGAPRLSQSNVKITTMIELHCPPLTNTITYLLHSHH